MNDEGNVFLRLLVAIVFVIVVVWLLGMTTIPAALIAILGLLAFCAVFFGWDRLR